jgi:hypothetical protein
VVIFDGVAPNEWKDGGGIFLNVLPPLEGFRSENRPPVEWPEILDWKADHPVLRYVSFSNVLVSKAQAWTVPKAAQVLVESPGVPLLVAWDSDRVRALGLAFDLFESDWAYRPTLPLFVRNAVLWAGEVSPRRRPAAVKTGEPLVIRPYPDAPTGTLVRPDGQAEKIQLSPDRKTFYERTDEVGLYRLMGLPGGKEFAWAVNLASAQESDNARRGSLWLGDQEVAATPGAISTKREIWHWLVLAALGLLLVEWLVYHRRVGL